MGIPIDGNVNNFRKKLKGKGLTYDEKVSYSYVYKGNFAGDESNVFVLFNNKTNNVYAVGVAINCSSERIAQDKYWRYVRDLINKYNAISMKDILVLYKDTTETFNSYITNRNVKGFNFVTTDSIENETEIKISEIVLERLDSTLLNIPVKMGVMYQYFSCSGNVGTIKLNYQRNTNSFSYDDVYELSIMYIDDQNTEALMDKRKEDL